MTERAKSQDNNLDPLSLSQMPRRRPACTKHQDLKRLNIYLSRATKIKGNWKKDKYSPNNLAINLLWNNKWIFTFWSLIILQSQAAQATQQQTRPPKPNKRKSLNYSKMHGARPPNNSDRPFPTNDFRIFWTIILKCAVWGTSGGSYDAKVNCIVDD